MIRIVNNGMTQRKILIWLLWGSEPLGRARWQEGRKSRPMGWRGSQTQTADKQKQINQLWGHSTKDLVQNSHKWVSYTTNCPASRIGKLISLTRRGRVNLHRPNIFMLEEIHYTLARAVMVHSHHPVIICIYMGKGEDYSTYLLNFHHAWNSSAKSNLKTSKALSCNIQDITRYVWVNA